MINDNLNIPEYNKSFFDLTIDAKNNKYFTNIAFSILYIYFFFFLLKNKTYQCILIIHFNFMFIKPQYILKTLRKYFELQQRKTSFLV